MLLLEADGQLVAAARLDLEEGASRFSILEPPRPANTVLPRRVLEAASGAREPLAVGDPDDGRTYCWLPLSNGSRTVGALVLGGSDPDPQRLAVLGLLADQAAVAIVATEVAAALAEENADLRGREEEREGSEELYRRAISQAGGVPYVLDYGSDASAKTGRYTFIGEQIVDLTGYSAAEMSPSLWREIVAEYVPLGDQAGLDESEALQRTRAGEFSRWRCDYRIVTRDGETRWIADASIEVVDDHGRPKGSIGMLQDITERKRAEERLTRSEELYRRAIAQAGGVPYILDYGTSSYPSLGDGIEALTGYTPAEFTPDLWESIAEEVILTGEQAGLSGEVARARTRAGEFRQWRCDQRIRTKSGESRWVADASVEIIGDDGESIGSIGMLQDITDRKRAEEQLGRFAAILEATTDLVGMADPDGRPLYLNRAGRRLLGIADGEDLSGTTIADVHPAWAAELVLEEGLPTAAREGSWAGETAFLSRDGREIPVSQVLLAHRDDLGAVRFFSTIARDLSEWRALEEQLRQAQKMEAVGRLAGGVAHDFNNLLTAIGGYSLLILDRLPPEDPLREDVEEITKAGELAAALTQQLLAFSRRQVLQPQVLDLNEVVADVESLLRRLIREDIVLVTQLGSEPIRVSADPGQLNQVIVNLVVNARDAMPTGGRLTIRTESVDLERGYVRSHVVAEEGPFALLAVSDTGIGMDAETRGHIFEPFFTTKQRGKGTGLGLATVFGIVEQSGGHIFVYSEPGEGTTFRIYLPRVDDAPVTPRSTSPGVETLAGNERILLVEDDETVRSFAREALRALGYSVVEAANGEEAVQVVDEERIDVVVTDLVMPGLNGREVAERVTARWPGVRVLFMSGYTDDAVFRFGTLPPNHGFLQKPFTPDVLARRVRELVASPS